MSLQILKILGNRLKKSFWISTVLTTVIMPIIVEMVISQYHQNTGITTGELWIECNVNRAEIFMNGDFCCLSRDDAFVSAGQFVQGTYILEAKKQGFVSSKMTIKITKDRKVSEFVELTPDTIKKIPVRKNNKSSEPDYYIPIMFPEKYKDVTIFMDGRRLGNRIGDYSVKQGIHEFEIIARVNRGKKIYRKTISVNPETKIMATENEFIFQDK